MAFQQSGPSEIGGGGQASPLPDLADIEQKAFRSKGFKLPITPPPPTHTHTPIRFSDHPTALND